MIISRLSVQAKKAMVAATPGKMKLSEN